MDRVPARGIYSHDRNWCSNAGSGSLNGTQNLEEERLLRGKKGGVVHAGPAQVGEDLDLWPRWSQVDQSCSRRVPVDLRVIFQNLIDVIENGLQDLVGGVEPQGEYLV